MSLKKGKSEDKYPQKWCHVKMKVSMRFLQDKNTKDCHQATRSYEEDLEQLCLTVLRRNQLTNTSISDFLSQELCFCCLNHRIVLLLVDPEN